MHGFALVLDGQCTLDLAQGAEGSINDLEKSGEFGIVTQVRAADYYTGDTTVTPSAETHVLDTHGLLLSSDITINPIPTNYGLIQWDGAVLTVS